MIIPLTEALAPLQDYAWMKRLNRKKITFNFGSTINSKSPADQLGINHWRQ
jgi:hypothetical protein